LDEESSTTIYLKQSTDSQEIPLGYFVDSTDGDTEETGLTIINTDIKIWKNGATTLANKHSGGALHISNGIYYATLDATDTDTLGSMVIFVHVTGALTVRVEAVVLAANIFDSLIGNSDRLQIDCRELGDANLALTTQMKTDLDTEIDARLDTAVPASPTANSLFERVKTMDDAYTAARGAYLDKLVNLLKIGKNKWSIAGTTFTIYDDDGTTPLYSFTLDDANAPTQRTPI
jgi:hypothetical protein